MVDFLSRIIGYRSGESNPHFANISILSALLLQALQKRKNHYGLTEHDCQLIATAAVFHDVGKIGIPESILLKPGKLTAKEFEVMKTHTLIGDNLIKSLEIYHDEPLLQMAAQICRWHHERYDGGGYPDGLKGEEIPHMRPGGVHRGCLRRADERTALQARLFQRKGHSNDFKWRVRRV